jgi:hypothetical protein
MVAAMKRRPAHRIRATIILVLFYFLEENCLTFFNYILPYTPLGHYYSYRKQSCHNMGVQVAYMLVLNSEYKSGVTLISQDLWNPSNGSEVKTGGKTSIPLQRKQDKNTIGQVSRHLSRKHKLNV